MKISAVRCWIPAIKLDNKLSHGWTLGRNEDWTVIIGEDYECRKEFAVRAGVALNNVCFLGWLQQPLWECHQKSENRHNTAITHFCAIIIGGLPSLGSFFEGEKVSVTSKLSLNERYNLELLWGLAGSYPPMWVCWHLNNNKWWHPVLVCVTKLSVWRTKSIAN